MPGLTEVEENALHLPEYLTLTFSANIVRGNNSFPLCLPPALFLGQIWIFASYSF